MSEQTLDDRFEEEEDPIVLLALADLAEPGLLKRALLSASVRLPTDAPDLLQLLVSHGETVEWTSLRPLAGHADPRIRLRCLQLCRAWTDIDAIEWLGSVVEAGRYVRPADAELAWLLDEDIESLQEEGVDVQAELSRSKARRRLLLRAMNL